jgi:predicted glycoside hydrolase/deacetylase ChbG (UPF0249 family)
MKIIFNADDFGYSKGINYGIIESCKHGVVRSTTVMANMHAFDHAIELAWGLSELKIGVHLNISSGKSLGTGYKTLTDENGEFFKHTFLYGAVDEGLIDLAEVENEYNLQIEKIANAGIAPSHLDGHHHLHSVKGVLEITLRLAKKHGLPVRLDNKIALASEFVGIKRVSLVTSFFGENVTVEHMENVLSNCTADTEIMCHPGYVDSYLKSTSGYSDGRLREMELLTSHSLAELLSKYNHTPASFCDI